MKFHKLMRIGLLMIVSEVLISVFVMRWLQSEFNGEKMELHKTLFDQFSMAKSRVMDSLISKNLITPILNDTEDFKIRHLDLNHSNDGEDSLKIIAMSSEFDVIGKDTGKKEGTADAMSAHHANVKIHIIRDSSDKLIYHGVKMFISKVTGPQGEKEFFAKHLLPGDTVMLKNFFAQNLEQNHLNVNAVWKSSPPEKKFPPEPFYYESQFFDHPYGVQIERYDGLLLKKILPQILFGLLLLVVTGAAFIFSFYALRNQVRLAAVKDDFISNMSHELKTPVATIKVAVEAMQQMDTVEKKDIIKDYLGMASQELNRLELLIDKVMNSILMEDKNHGAELQSLDLKKLIHQTLSSQRLHLEQQQAKVNFKCDNDQVIIEGDAVHIQGLLTNLIDNSLKYAGNEPEISIHLFRSGNDVFLNFSDNGPGIPGEYLSRIFEKFFRVPAGNHHNVKGYGLGLNYVEQVMRLHHGSVSVKNLSGGKTGFTMIFPGIK